MKAYEISTALQGVDALTLVEYQDLSQSLQAVRFSRKIEIIGVINGIKGEVDITTILQKHARVQGISVGSRDSFEAMNRAVSQQKLHPVIDRVFPFDKAKETMAHL